MTKREVVLEAARTLATFPHGPPSCIVLELIALPNGLQGLEDEYAEFYGKVSTEWWDIAGEIDNDQRVIMLLLFAEAGELE